MSLQPQFSLRPVSTKYAHFPIVDTQISNEIPIYKKPYNVGLIFNPGPTNCFSIGVCSFLVKILVVNLSLKGL